MSPYAIAGLVMIASAILIVLVTGLIAAVRTLRLMRRAQALAKHPTLVAAQGFSAVQARLEVVRSKAEAIKARRATIAADIAELMESSAALRLQVDRVGFATVLLLQTFVPTLRGSMSDFS
ncbi:MAG: hypothetical protein JOY87_06385 [Candidatus Eremiobacteraeota bacterium]|nr:hypothetical protein [Candidatus Eremiobacteraeota bacterium]MBV8340500.1 hypothetical protein [Candidatus Eremiobacteraeota bacterium]MBV8459366.1 hypothetical protein [Candidatus Eremiobacteraeota bacterium]MBV8669534.1 hypothetical protein [Candidatus Eremiobacteraeota bacterium]MBV8670324.1 hypothetical protein [Candidatus Eremiobacteraeota bacterium]